MPYYRFGISEQYQLYALQWYDDDVEAMAAAAEIMSEMLRDHRNEDPIPFVMAFRVKVDA